MTGTNGSDKSILSFQVHTSDSINTIHVPGLEFRDYTIARAAVYRNEQSLEACINTGSLISMISKRVLKNNYLDVPLRFMPQGKPILVSGLGSGVECNSFVVLPLMFKSNHQVTVEINAEVHVLNHLPCDLLLGNNILTPNEMGLHTTKDRQQHLQLKGHNIPISTRKDILLQKAVKKRTSVYLTEAVTLPPSTSINLPIKHWTLPPAERGYIFEPIPRVDLSLGIYSTAIKALIEGDKSPIPYSNLGEQAVHLPKGLLIRHLSMSEASPYATETYISMEEIFKAVGQDNANTGGEPYLTHPTEEMESVKADISDHWGAEYKEKIQKVIDQEASLFRSELGRFNDGVDMPIPFKDELDVEGLKQSPYNLSRRDQKALDSIMDPLKLDS